MISSICELVMIIVVYLVMEICIDSFGSYPLFMHGLTTLHHCQLRQVNACQSINLAINNIFFRKTLAQLWLLCYSSYLKDMNKCIKFQTLVCTVDSQTCITRTTGLLQLFPQVQHQHIVECQLSRYSLVSIMETD